jgi:hypothetical protein
MMIVKKIRSVALASMLLSVSAVASDWEIMPFLNDGWSPNFTFALTAGKLNINNGPYGTNDSTYGAQLSLDCPWFQPPEGTLRQQFNYNVYDDNTLKIKTFELNPHYYLGNMKEGLSYGFGPGFGYAWVTPNNISQTGFWTLQASVDVEYRVDEFFVGLGTRYQWSENNELGSSGVSQDIDNWLTQLKIGINF